MLKRATSLAAGISAPPAAGTYANNEATFALTTIGNKLQITGDAYDRNSGNSCYFEGEGQYGPGWIRMRHVGLPDFYLLPAGNEILLQYSGTGSAQGCGYNVDFKGAYTRQ